MEQRFTIQQNSCELHCLLRRSSGKSMRHVILCLHGFGDSKEEPSFRQLAEQILPAHGETALLSFDLPAHGEDGQPVLELSECRRYLNAAVDCARETLGAETVSVNAVSFGGWVVLDYLAQHGNPFRRIVLRCPAVPMHQALTGLIMTPGNFSELSERGETAVGFAVKVKIRRSFLDELRAAALSTRDFRPFADSILLLHGTEDEVVPYDDIRRFAARNGLLLEATEGADHRFLGPGQMAAAVARTAEFLTYE